MVSFDTRFLSSVSSQELSLAEVALAVAQARRLVADTAVPIGSAAFGRSGSPLSSVLATARYHRAKYVSGPMLSTSLLDRHIKATSAEDPSTDPRRARSHRRVPMATVYDGCVDGRGVGVGAAPMKTGIDTCVSAPVTLDRA